MIPLLVLALFLFTGCGGHSMAFNEVYNVTTPVDSQAANLFGADIRNTKLDIQQRMASISGLDTAKPAFGSDTQPTNWTGLLYFATDTGKIYQWSGSAWVDKTATIIPPYLPFRAFDSSNSGTCSVTVPAGTIVDGSVIDVFAVGGTASGLGTGTLTINSTAIETTFPKYRFNLRTRLYVPDVTGVTAESYIGQWDSTLSSSFGSYNNFGSFNIDLSNTFTVQITGTSGNVWMLVEVR